MISYRLVKANDWPAISQLANQVFAESLPMEQSFPLLFNECNTFSYVAVDEQKVIGFIGVLPEEICSGQARYYGSRIGAVCISNDYQGQGIGRSLFRVMKAAAQFDFILVSGQGKLYIQEGCELFGEFEQFVVPAKSSQIEISEYTGELPQLFALHQLLQQRETYFDQSPFHLQELIKAHALENLWSGKQQVFLASANNEWLGCLITCSRVVAGKPMTEVLEYGGKPEIIMEMAQQLAVTLPHLLLRTPKASALSAALKTVAPAEVVGNAGSVLYLNQKIKEVTIPHTWDLAFL